MTKIPNFENSRWGTAAISKIVLSLYLSQKSSEISTKFGTQMQILLPRSAAEQNTKILQIQNGGRPPYWISSFGYISTNDYPINAKFWRIKQNHVLTEVIWPKYQISKTQDGGRPPFWKWLLSLYLSRKSSDLNEIWYADADCASEVSGRLLKNAKILLIKNGGRPPYWKLSFGYISTNDYRINATFCRIKQNHVLTHDTWPKCQISAAILKMVLPLYLSRKSSDFNEIWYADADCAFKVGYWTKY